MTWTTTITPDRGKPTVGMVCAHFTDTDSSTYQYQERVSFATQNEANAFADKAIAGRDAWRTEKTQNATAQGLFTTAFARDTST